MCMVYRSTLETSIGILEILAKNREMYQYNLPKMIGKSYRQILRHLEQLERINFIRITRFEPAAKKGKDKKVYALTLNGLLAYLQYQAIKNPENFSSIVGEIGPCYPNYLPLVFGKWKLWHENGLIEAIIKSMQKNLIEEVRPLANLICASTFIQFRKWGETLPKVGESKTVGQMPEQDINVETVSLQQIWTTKILLNLEQDLETKFFETIRKDNELTNFIKQTLQDILNKYIKDVYNIKSWMKILE